jgi:hypothetical protein
MNRQANEQSKFSNCAIWNALKNKNVYTHLFQHAFMLLKFYAFTISHKQTGLQMRE